MRLEKLQILAFLTNKNFEFKEQLESVNVIYTYYSSLLSSCNYDFLLSCRTHRTNFDFIIYIFTCYYVKINCCFIISNKDCLKYYNIIDLDKLYIHFKHNFLKKTLKSRCLGKRRRSV